MKNQKLQNLLKRLNSLEQSLPIDESKTYLERLLDEETKNFQTRLKDNPSVQFLDGFNAKLEQFKKDFNLGPIITEIENIQGDIENFRSAAGDEFNRIAQEMEGKSNELISSIKSVKDELSVSSKKDIADALGRIGKLQEDLSYQSENSSKTGQSLKGALADFEKQLEILAGQFRISNENRMAIDTAINAKLGDADIGLKNAVEAVEKLRKEIFSRLAEVGGGNANRNIAVGGNVSVLSKYTDINLKAGSNVTLTYSNNETTKYLDLTIAATGGGGGTTRSINSISTNTAAGSTSGTDYVYICTGTITVTLPTAVGNANLYTIKNTGTGVVTIDTTGGQTIDAQASIQLSTQYTSVDLISDGSNWNIT